MRALQQPTRCSWTRPGLVCSRNVRDTAGHSGKCRTMAVDPHTTPSQPVCIEHIMSPVSSSVSVWQIPDSPDFPPEVRNSRILMIDESGNTHSIYRENQVLTGAYWDCLALLPALVPEGPLIILGLGAGTIAHLVHHLYPKRIMHGWELDPAVINVAEQHMGMNKLTSTGTLVAHVGDALSGAASVDGDGAAGIIVDLFAEGQLLPQLTQVSSWLSIKQRLAPGGRVIANLGAAPLPGRLPGQQDPQAFTTRLALEAMAEAFEGQLTSCSITCGFTANMVAITGPPLSAEDWASVPEELKQYVDMAWEPWVVTSR